MKKSLKKIPGIYHGCGNGRRSSCLRQLCIHVPVPRGIGQRPAVSDEPIKILMYSQITPRCRIWTAGWRFRRLRKSRVWT